MFDTGRHHDRFLLTHRSSRLVRDDGATADVSCSPETFAALLLGNLNFVRARQDGLLRVTSHDIFDKLAVLFPRPFSGNRNSTCCVCNRSRLQWRLDAPVSSATACIARRLGGAAREATFPPWDPDGMFIFPFSTDAPVYFWPFASVGLIVINTIVFLAMITGGISSPENWILSYGQGLHPEQWLTSVFMHASLDHLVGNMMFLWVFGLVVEGKLGWQKFLACYLSIGIGQSMLEQMIMLFHSEGGGSFGASAAIFGLMVMAAVWAPKNDITFGYLIFFRWGTFDISILTVALSYSGLQILFLILSSGGEGSSWLHLMGMALGAPLAIVMMRRGVVDCEGWDLLHVWKGDYGGFREEPDPQEMFTRAAERQQKSDQMLLADAKLQIRKFLMQGNLLAALTLYRKMSEVGDGIRLENDELRAIIKALHLQESWAESAPFMAELIERFPDKTDAVRIKLAQICVVEFEAPGQGTRPVGRGGSFSLEPGTGHPGEANREQGLRHAGRRRGRIRHGAMVACYSSCRR